MAVVTTTAPAVAVGTADLPAGRYVDWGAIIVGTLGALAMLVVLMTFGSALGLSIASPYPYAGASAKALTVIAGVYAAIVHVASFATGGYLAGRLRTPWATTDEVERHFRDGAHGFAVWALGVVLGAALAFSAVAGIAKTVTQATTAVAAAGTAGAASNPAVAQLSQQPTDYAVDRILAPAPGAQAAAATPGAGTSRSDLAAPIARAFAANMNNPQLDARDRATLASLVSQRTGMSQADSEKRVDEAFAELKAAEQKAREAADKARKATLIAAFLAAATLAIGCAAACAGAALGAGHRDDRTLVVLFGSRRFW